MAGWKAPPFSGRVTLQMWPLALIHRYGCGKEPQRRTHFADGKIRPREVKPLILRSS